MSLSSVTINRLPRLSTCQSNHQLASQVSQVTGARWNIALWDNWEALESSGKLDVRGNLKPRQEKHKRGKIKSRERFYQTNYVTGNLKPREENWNIRGKKIKMRGNLKPREDGPAGDERPRQAGEAGEVRGEELSHWLLKKKSRWKLKGAYQLCSYSYISDKLNQVWYIGWWGVVMVRCVLAAPAVTNISHSLSKHTHTLSLSLVCLVNRIRSTSPKNLWDKSLDYFWYHFYL